MLASCHHVRLRTHHGVLELQAIFSTKDRGVQELMGVDVERARSSLSQREGGTLNCAPSADAVAGNGHPLSWAPSADAVAGGGNRAAPLNQQSSLNRDDTPPYGPQPSASPPALSWRTQAWPG